MKDYDNWKNTKQVSTGSPCKNPSVYVNSYRRQILHRGKVDPGVSELSRNHVFQIYYSPF